ncbi:hypothetical protein HNQ63_000784 [Wenzhouxiangella marina]|uniref:Uncharacterized protein n=1 Tax=Wenzhouxiangella marina TaxID=1579979 RepID=A0A0K0XW91_9GAMM|nr:hypothetical protein WM2015_1516 [Wenzhouxiangella marina]MBB6086347.1 hypothetical protein [Wenzhouxiangella marina]
MDRRAHARSVYAAALLAFGQPHRAFNLRWRDLRDAKPGWELEARIPQVGR